MREKRKWVGDGRSNYVGEGVFIEEIKEIEICRGI